MTREGFATILSGACSTVFFDHAPLGTAVPYLTYTWEYNNNFGADDKVYQRIASITVQHYHNDYSDGSNLKAALDAAGIFWECESDYDSNENLYIDTYTMEVIENGEED